MYFDSHAHYDDKRFDEDRHEVLSSLAQSGVDNVINVGASMSTSKRAVQLADDYPFVYASCGVHPHDVKDLIPGDMDRLSSLLSHPKVVALGEIGLDYYYDNSPRDLQKEWFAKQLEVAIQLSLPIIVHCRDAYMDCLNILKPHGKIRGVMHCFSGSVEFMRQVIELGMYISIAGPVTYRNASKLRDVVRDVPEDRFLIETDCPYLSPEPNRGKRNSSLNLTHIANAIAEVRGISIEETAEITTNNTRELFGL